MQWLGARRGVSRRHSKRGSRDLGQKEGSRRRGFANSSQGLAFSSSRTQKNFEMAICARESGGPRVEPESRAR